MGFFKNPAKAIKSSLGGMGGAVLGHMILPGIGGVIGGALGQGTQHKLRGKSFAGGALKGGTFGAGYPLVSSILPSFDKKRKSPINLGNPINQGQITPWAPPPKSQELLANEQMTDNFRNKLYRDQMALKSSNLPIYLGENDAPMSPLTQKARMLRAEANSKPAPYSKKVEATLKKEATGFSPEQSKVLLDMIRRDGGSEKSAVERLQKQFGNNYGYEPERENRLIGKIGKDSTRANESTEHNFRKLNEEFAELEKSRNMDLAKSFYKAGAQKSGRKDALINQLEEFGNQEHALGNLQNRAKRDSFNEELEAPNRRIAAAYRGLNELGPEDDHPSKTAIRNKELQRLMSNYDAPHPTYPGQRVIGIQPETEQSFNLANAINPKYKDAYHADRKNIEKHAINNSLPNQVFKAIPGAIDPLMKNLDFLTSQQLKKQSKEIAGKHVRLGSYGSGSHKAETERAMRELLRKVHQEREGVVTGSTKAESALAARREQTALSKHRMMDLLGTQEHANLLSRNNDTNKLGWTKRANKQSEENSALRAWYNQLQHSTGVDTEGYGNLAKQYETDLSSLFNRPQTYNENYNNHNNYKKQVKNSLLSQYPSLGKQLDDYDEESKKALLGYGNQFSYNPNQSNAKAQAYMLAKGTPVA